MLRRIYYLLPPALRLLVRRVYYLPADVVRRLFLPNQLVPPKGLIYTGSGDYIQVGKTYLRYFREYAGLQPDHKVLDVGCGIGRMAVALTGYLSNEGHYDGFDIVRSGVRWCQKHITSRHPNFHFLHVHIANDLYVATGDKAEQFTFPYPDDTYDLTIVISVFTHMTRASLEQYLNQINQVLKESGRLFATFFILNEISRDRMQHQSFRFDHADNGCYLMDANVKSANVAYNEDDLNLLFSKVGFAVEHRLYGNWSGRAEGTLDFQDILVLKKIRN